jgi:CDP-ribitol ribitolphosphotransferase / teichoic acid ribitol-phosphate polymerase
MNSILFCKNKYAFGILAPIKNELEALNHDFVWFVDKKILSDFPYKSDPHTTSVKELKNYNSDAIFVCGNAVPHYLKGVKTQVFHGFAGEKKGHFRIRNYFDLYLTQGPYFTQVFLEKKEIHKDFEVTETGWSRIDNLFKLNFDLDKKKEDLLKKYKKEKIVLYAPTFSPKLTSAAYLKEEIESICDKTNYLLLIKFHPLMNKELKNEYNTIAKENASILIYDDYDITNLLKISDLLISDTSSVIYEFSLLNKPVITFNNIAKIKYWEDSKKHKELKSLIEINLKNDFFSKERETLIQNYHPNNDGRSALRMIQAVKEYIINNGVPEKRKLSLYRKLKIYKIFGN